MLGWGDLLFANCCVFELAVRVVLLCACFVCWLLADLLLRFSWVVLELLCVACFVVCLV